MCENVYELGHDKKARKTRRARHQLRNYVTARGFARFKASDGRKFEVYKSFKTFRQPLLTWNFTLKKRPQRTRRQILREEEAGTDSSKKYSRTVMKSLIHAVT